MVELDALITTRGICISIIIPTEKASEKKNYEALKKAVQRAKALLQDKSYPEDSKSSLRLKLDEAVKVLPHVVFEGIGVYVSSNQSSLISFPFPVHQKVVVGDRFETRALFYLKQYNAPYYVLIPGNRAVRLYSGVMDKLKEVKDGNFPVLLEQYEYPPPGGSAISSSLMANKKDNSALFEQHVKSMLKDTDIYLEPYLSGEDARLILSGTQKITKAFLALTRFSKKVIGMLPGRFSDMNFDLLEISAWQTYIRRKKKEDEQLVRQLIENDHGLLIDGIRDAWKDAHEGKGHLLAVEKDYHCQGFQLPDHDELLLQRPRKPYSVIPDVVDDLVETVNRKNGKIVFMDNGELTSLGHLALILRY